MATGETDFGLATKEIVRTLDRQPRLIRTRGMWGGYRSIRRAKPLLLHKLVYRGARPHVLCDMAAESRPVIAMHVRTGDFASEPPGPGEFNRSLPIEWFRSIGQEIRNTYGQSIDIDVVSDRAAPSTIELRRELGARSTTVGGSALDDLARLALADVLICSVSSFSLLAAFLSDRPYCWYEPQLSQEDGWASLWGHERGGSSEVAIRENIRSEQASDKTLSKDARGIALPATGHLTPQFHRHISYVLGNRQLRTDLLHYGVLRT